VNGSRLIPWFDPPRRAVILVERVHVGDTIRKRVRNRGWTTTVNAAFEEVIARCATGRRSPTTWITPPLLQTFRQLHDRGRAYSLEVWDADGALIGGVFGVQSGGIFSADSLFHAADHASKVALVDLAVRIREAGGLAIDCQEPKQHTSAVGAELLDRTAYRALLRQAAAVVPRLEVVRLPTSRLADVGRGRSS
jgi:leucyl/phenylalanyl-tRNA--protein transferase